MKMNTKKNLRLKEVSQRLQLSKAKRLANLTKSADMALSNQIKKKMNLKTSVR